MLTFPADAGERAANVVGILSPIAWSLAAKSGESMSEEQASQAICEAFQHFGEHPDQYTQGGQIVGAIFEGHASKDEMHARVDAGMGWSRNQYSPRHVQEEVADQLGVTLD